MIRSLSAFGIAGGLLLAGCAYGPAPDSRVGGDAAGPVRKGGAAKSGATPADRREPAIPERDRVLHDYRFAATALRQGKFDEAKARLDDAIARIGGIITNDAEAAKARGLFTAEATKPFIGEPYERVMAYYYRGILYWRDGEPDNARACFRTAELEDSSSEGEKYNG